MRPLLLSALVALLMPATMINGQNIQLPKPNQNRQTLSMSQTLATRHSVREFSIKELSLQDLSDICWAACGLSRDTEHITAASAMNRQEVRLFVFTRKATYEYIAKDNYLKHIADGDKRRLVAGTPDFAQDFVMDAPVSLVMVLDLNKLGGHDERSMMMGCVDVGNVSENVNLFCQAAGFVTVPRATMDTPAIKKLLGLNEYQLPVLNNPIGFGK